MTLPRDQTGEMAGGAPRPGQLVRSEDDAYSWALQQADLLRSGQAEGLDWVNLADEVTDVAHREFDRLESVLERLLHQMLVWDFRPEARDQSRLEDAVARGYARGRRVALTETRLPASAVPERIPYDRDDIMERIIVWPHDG